MLAHVIALEQKGVTASMAGELTERMDAFRKNVTRHVVEGPRLARRWAALEGHLTLGMPEKANCLKTV